MKNVLYTLLFLCGVQGFGQDFKSDFLEFYYSSDTINQLKTLQEWENKNPKDAELYAYYFFYYIDKSSKQLSFLVSQQDSLNYDKVIPEVHKGLRKIEKGIKLFPNRLDMRLEKITTLMHLEEWQNVTSEIIRVVQYSTQNNNQWTLTNNKAFKGGEERFLSEIQSYQYNIYNMGGEKLYPYVREIASEVMKYYPNNKGQLEMLSTTYIIEQDYDTALIYAKKAEEIASKDIGVLNTLARIYFLKNDKEKAIEYYQKCVEYGDENSKSYAQQQLQVLLGK